MRRRVRNAVVIVLILVNHRQESYNTDGMKKAVRFLAFVFVMVFSLTLCACSRAVPDVISSRYENLAAGGRLENSSGKAGDSAVFRFPSKTKINAVVLKEIGNSVTSFRIYADDGETPFYGNDYIGDYRYCAFATKEVSSLRIEVTGSDAEWELHSLEAYCVDNGADDFEVVSYINADTAYTLSSEYAATAAFVTQFNVFGGTYFDAQGKVHFADFEVNGVKIDGEVLFEQAINNIRILNPDAEIVFTLLGNRDFGDGMNTRERHNSAMGLFGETLTSNILSVISEFDLDGVSFDYEYPETEEDFGTFANYLTRLDNALGDKLLTAAVADWCIGDNGFSIDNLRTLDELEIMAYDLFDERGNHATFLSVYSVVQSLAGKGVDFCKVRLGLPFYSRPINGDTYWGLYRDVAERLAPYENAVYESYVNADGQFVSSVLNYYNGRQMIYDKTRYALDAGLGGVMVWHFGCDSPDPELSLFAQIGAALDGR